MNSAAMDILLHLLVNIAHVSDGMYVEAEFRNHRICAFLTFFTLPPEGYDRFHLSVSSPHLVFF
jgi:hypothetical protein